MPTRVYRLDETTGELTVVGTDFVLPNGLAFTADEESLYVVDSRERHIRRFDVVDGERLTGGAVFTPAPDPRKSTNLQPLQGAPGWPLY